MITYPLTTEPKFQTVAINQTNPNFAGVAFTVDTNSGENKSHAITANYNVENPAGEGGVAANFTSKNLKNSTMFVSGQNSDHATIKLTHTNKSGSEGGDAAAACLNLNCVKGTEAGTTCQGLRIGSEDEVAPNSKGPFVTCVRGTGASLKNISRILATGVYEMFEAEAEPGNPEAGKTFLWFEAGKMFAKKNGGVKKEIAAL